MTSLDQDTEIAARKFLAKIARTYDFAGAILFGSRARNDHRPDSDADIAILLKGKPASFVSTKLAMADVAYDVLLDTGIRIQPLPIWESEWLHPDEYSNPSLLHAIDRQGIRL